jgi:hypothetical protein
MQSLYRTIMSFELVHVRCHEGADQRKQLMILSSVSHYFQIEPNEEQARRYISACSKNSEATKLVVFFTEEDMPREAFAVKQGSWRDLGLLMVAPLPDDLSTLNLYSGNHTISPILVKKW